MRPTIVVNCRDLYSGWAINPVYVYIGRPSKWGNPFVVGLDGAREEVIEKYRKWITDQPGLMGALGELRGKILVCYCKPLPCHGDVLLALLKEADNGPKKETREA